MTWNQIREHAEERTVNSGENLTVIAAEYQTSPGLIARINSIENPNLIRSGRKLKVLRGPFEILVSKSGKQLTVSRNGVPLRTYAVATGKADSTPEGAFKVRKKLIKPVWDRPV